MNKRDQIPQVVVNLHVRYYKPLRDGTSEALIPCHSWEECMGHEIGFSGVAKTERRPLDSWRSVGQVSHDVITKLGDLCSTTKK